MPVPSHCPNAACPSHTNPPVGWFRRFGWYRTLAHGRVQRFRCRSCGRTCSTQTESMHYYAKRHLPLRALARSLLEGASQREIAQHFRVSPMTIQSAMVRLGRQAIATQVILLSYIEPRGRLVFDGLRSFITSQDYPCDLTTLVDATGETILAITHGVFLRGGQMTLKQHLRVEAKQDSWRIPEGTLDGSMSQIWQELWRYLDFDRIRPALVDTDQHPAYRRIVHRSPVYKYLRSRRLMKHRTTSSTAPRTMDNPLFPVNYVDRLIRHRLREHTRETIAFARHSAMQMYRMWVFAWDLNTRRPWRVKKPDQGVHSEQGTVCTTGRRALRRINREFFQRRVDIVGRTVPESLQEAWRGSAVPPPIRWKKGQNGTTVTLPAYAARDLIRGWL